MKRFSISVLLLAVAMVASYIAGWQSRAGLETLNDARDLARFGEWRAIAMDMKQQARFQARLKKLCKPSPHIASVAIYPSWYEKEIFLTVSVTGMGQDRLDEAGKRKLIQEVCLTFPGASHNRVNYSENWMDL